MTTHFLIADQLQPGDKLELKVAGQWLLYTVERITRGLSDQPLIVHLTGGASLEMPRRMPVTVER